MKQRLIQLFACALLLSPALFAQGFPLQSIEAALEDELYELAEQQIWRSLSVPQTAGKDAHLTLLLVRSLIGQTRFNDAVILAGESTHLLGQDAFAYWRARAFFEAKNFEALFQTLKTDKKLLRAGVYAPAALRLLGRAEQITGNPKAAEAAFARCWKTFPNAENADQNLLDLAEIQLERGRQKAATRTRQELLKHFPASALADSVRLLLARELIADGGKKEVQEAAGLLKQLGRSEATRARLRIAAWMELAALEQRAGRAAAAADALLSAETLTDEATLRVRQKTARANLLVDEGKSEEALTLFDEAIQIAPDDQLAADTLLQKAEALLKSEQYEAAEQAFQAYLNVTEDPSGEARALYGKGWSLWEQSRPEEAAAAFERTATKSNNPEISATAWVKAGDARFAAKQFERAFKNYQAVSKKHADSPLAARATYQSGAARRASGDAGGAHLQFLAVETNFPDSEFAPRAALQRAELLKNEKGGEPALQEYQRIATQYTNGVVQATALHQQGLIRFELDQFSKALENFQAVSTGYPASPEAPQAAYMQGFCRYLQGDIDTALQICQTFVENYPDSLWTPNVLFWLSEHAYNRGDYPQAHTSFLDIATRFPENELADEALFWAANSLLRQDSFLDAFLLYSRLAKEHPQSALLLKTRFAQGEVLSELGEFPRAILAYEEVIKSSPDDPLTDRARGRLGDCLFILGTTDADRYPEAIRAYQALYNRPATPFGLKLQALYKMARCEEKMQLADSAFTHYTETVYAAINHPETLPPGAVLWFTRAALDAAASLERQTRWKEAVHIYERILEANVPARDEASRRIEKIKQEHAEEF